MREPDAARSTLDPALIREQLKRLLADPLFTHSKRYPVLLAYTVEQTLLGNAGELKERAIGVEAFGREPNYDVSLDAVVRTTAAEVRRRLIQYYYNPAHAGEPVIELPVGSYVANFRGSSIQAMRSAPAPVLVPKNIASQKKTELPLQEFSLPNPDSGHLPSRLTGRGWFSVAAALAFAALLGFGAGRIGSSNQPSDSGRLSNLQRFWEPITTIPGKITYCLGEPLAAVNRERGPADDLEKYASLNVSDVTTLARSIVPLVPRNGSFRVLAASQASFEQLREGPDVLIGAFDNPWTMRITQDLPIGFEHDRRLRKVVDRRSVEQKQWAVQAQFPDARLAQDYAIVARIRDKVTGQPVIILAGIWGEGTEAASEVVSNPVYLKAMLEKAPKNWEHLNLEAVIETHLIDGNPGPPTVLAVETW